MAIDGYTFDLAQVPAAADGSLYDFLSFGRDCVIPDRLNNCAVTTSGLTVTVATGQLIYQGRFIEISSPTTLTLAASSSGSIVVTIDLTQTNTATGTPGADYTFTNAQVIIESVTSVTTSDLNNGGLISSFVLGTWTSTASSITFTQNADAYSTKVNFDIGQFSMQYDDNTQNTITYSSGFSAASSGAPGTSFTTRRNGICFLTLGFNSTNALPAGIYTVGTISNPNHYPWQTAAGTLVASTTGSVGQYMARFYVQTSGMIQMQIYAPSTGGTPANVNFYGGCSYMSSVY